MVAVVLHMLVVDHRHDGILLVVVNRALFIMIIMIMNIIVVV
jgi:hypothetical protein